MNYLKLTNDKLSVDSVSELVTSETCGAISLFIGTTRDNFEGKEVKTLEYEAYEPMALKLLENICKQIREQWSSVENIAIYHRLGTVAVKESSIIIAISSPHRNEAIKATEWCINNVKTNVPIWKKETYADEKAEWKENHECLDNRPTIPKRRRFKRNIQQKVKETYVPPHFVQIKASNDDLDKRIAKFMESKRSELDVQNIKEFCSGDRNSEFTCARVDSIFQRRKDSKSHLQINRVLNNYHRDQTNSDYLTKFLPINGVEERMRNLECQLSLRTPVPKNIYKRLQLLEDRLLMLESISPEYIQFWDKTKLVEKRINKKLFSLDEIDNLIAHTQKKLKPS